MTDAEAPQSDKATTLEQCPTCNGVRRCQLHGHAYVPWTWEDDKHGFSVAGGVDHSLLQCMGCETVFYLHDSWHDEDYDYWTDFQGQERCERNRTKITYPKPVGQRPPWLEALDLKDADLKNILDQVYTAADADCLILASIGIRTAVDRATEILGIDPAKTFVEKLNGLASGGWIGRHEREVLDIVTDAGSAAAHRGWEPDDSEFSKLMMATEMFIQRAILFDNGALEVKESIPPRPGRN